jgi:Glycosyltransferase family 87
LIEHAQDHALPPETLAAEPARALAPRRPETHGRRPGWLDRRRLMAAYAAFGAYALVFAFLSGGRDQVWAIWAAAGYAAALLILWRTRSRAGVAAALGVSVALAVVAPLLWLSVGYPLEAGMVVIDRAAALLLHHGSPYLPADQVTSWMSYDPYLPVMALFGLPAAAGLGGLPGNPGVWLAVATVAVLAAAFLCAQPHSRCARCRRTALLGTAIAVASPVIALNLAVITTDPPVLALMLLSLAVAARSETAGGDAKSAAIGSGVALGVACDLKSTAWLAVPVLVAMFASRDGSRAAYRFIAATAATVAALIAATAPAVLFRPGAATALVRDSVLFPLGLTSHKTPAESLLPGHLLATTGAAGHVASVGLLLAAALAVALSLVVRPPRDVAAATRRLATGLVLMFLLGPDVRFGYFIYPLGLIGWLALRPSAHDLTEPAVLFRGVQHRFVRLRKFSSFS